MNMENNAVKLSHNPLGIIALFILLIYGFATLLFGFVGNVFSNNQKWWFVIFLIVFPVAVLFVFTFLVVWHHEKLYAPGEFQNEDHFMGFSSQNEKEKQYEKEEERRGVDKCNKTENREQLLQRRFEENEKRQRIENLVYEYYEKKFDYEIQRNTYYEIKGNKIIFDGTVEKDEVLTFIRIKYLPSGFIPKPLLATIIFNAIKVKEFLQRNDKYPNYRYRLLLVFVVDTDVPEKRREIQQTIQNMIETESININLRTYMIKELEEGVKIKNTCETPA